MSKLQYLLGTLSLLLVLCNGLPVVPKEPEVQEESLLDEEDTGLEYDRYLRQVIKVLEKDPDMRKRMEELSLEDLKEGNFARELGFLSANIRSKLDELKRVEVGRLRTVARQRMEAQMAPGSNKKMDPKAIENMVGHVDPANMGEFTDQDFERLIKKHDKAELEGILGDHVDLENPHFFEESDFVQLIAKAAADLDEADKERKKEFKRYEMEKELQRRQQLKEMDESNRGKAEEEFKMRKEKIKNHPKIKHPASKAQMQDVWEETDHLDRDDFNPKTFFALHDTNGDRKLDMFELEALFIKEVAKIYEDDIMADPVEIEEEVSRMREHVMREVEKIYKDKDGDPREKFEEMSRMREHVLREIDLDGDKMVSKEEFLKAADQAQFEDDEGWKDLNQEDQFTEDELQDYNKMVQERLERKKIRMQNINQGKEGLNINQGNVQMNQQVNQPPPPGGDPKLRVNQPPQPPVNQQVPQVNVNQAAAQQVAAQQAAQQAAAQQAAQLAAAQARAAQQAAAQQGQVPPQQGQPQGGVPQQQQLNQQQQQQQLNQQQQQMIEAQKQHQLKLEQEQLKLQQEAQAQQQLKAQQQQLNAQQQAQINAQKQQQLNAEQQQQVNAQQQQQQQINAQQQLNQQQQPIKVEQGQGQPIQGQPPAMPPQGQAQGQPPQGGAPGQPPAQPAQ